ncbi:hypothetical protein CR513_20804, partial [Mucuna pruriens]
MIQRKNEELKVKAPKRKLQNQEVKVAIQEKKHLVKETSYGGSTLNILIAIILVKYKDKILYDVVLMEATHILLGRPWQLDTKVTHDVVTTKFSFVPEGNKVTLKPLTPKEVQKD